MKKEENIEGELTLSDTPTIIAKRLNDFTASIRQEKWDECEWCFQFDDEEPQVFAFTNHENESDKETEITFTLSNTKGTNISFVDNKSGKTFKLFGREMTDKGRELRTVQTFDSEKNYNNK